jgi:acetyl-CoA carboxylase biotin carboxyl carrier protein
MPNSGFDTKLVKDLAKILRDSELSEIEIDHQGTKIRVTRKSPSTQIIAPNAAPTQYYAPQLEASAPVASVAAPIAAEAAKPAASSANNVNSPMVGTAYVAPEPGARPFVNVGDTVREGQQLFIVEAMKTLNAVTAPRAGVISAVFVKDGQPVEFGEPLCTID